MSSRSVLANSPNPHESGAELRALDWAKEQGITNCVLSHVTVLLAVKAYISQVATTQIMTGTNQTILIA